MAAKRVCSVADCGKPAHARGLCNKHYIRLRNHGDPAVLIKDPDRICSIPGCGKPHCARGWCSMHWARWRKWGDPTVEHAYESELLRFIHERAVPYKGDDCFIWPYGMTSGGYGAILIDGHQRGVHTVICELVHGPKPNAGFEVAHGCGVRSCCNPKHLRWATRSDNHSDKLKHGTHNRGERHSRAKLTEADVREIRSLQGKMTQSALARRFGVSPATLREILIRKIWAWLD